jgi:hypothetical protein
LNIVQLTKESDEIKSLLDSPFEFDDWIFDACFLNWQESIDKHVMIVCAHNTLAIVNLEKRKVERTIDCAQKCML